MGNISFKKFKKDIIKINKIYEEFRQDELKTKWIHHPAKFEYTQPFEYRSKEMGFVKWLVEKDLIDIEKFYSMTQNIEEIWRKINPPKIEVSLDNVKDPLLEFEKQRKKYLAEWLIMFLAIQDEPIRVLISILK